jgi:hypothetical protein
VLRFIDPANDYRMAAVASRRLAGQSRRSSTIDLAAVLEFPEAERRADMLLRDIWSGRETAELRLPPSAAAVEAGDILAFDDEGRPEILLVERVEDGASRTLRARRVDNRMRPAPLKPERNRPPATVPTWGPPEVLVVDFAPPDGFEAHAPRIAAFADPWPGAIAVYSGAGGGFRLVATLSVRFRRDRSACSTGGMRSRSRCSAEPSPGCPRSTCSPAATRPPCARPRAGRFCNSPRRS